MDQLLPTWETHRSEQRRFEVSITIGYDGLSDHIFDSLQTLVAEFKDQIMDLNRDFCSADPQEMFVRPVQCDIEEQNHVSRVFSCDYRELL